MSRQCRWGCSECSAHERGGGGTKYLPMVEFFTGSLEKWKNRECLKLDLTGREEEMLVEKQGKVDEKGITFLS